MTSSTDADPAPLESLAFHRLALARPRAAWWHPLLTGVVGVGLYIVMLLMVFVPLGISTAFVPGGMAMLDELLLTTTYFDLDRPWLLLVLVVPLILMLPALLLASRMVQGRGVGLLSSVWWRLRWGWLRRMLLLAVAVFAVYFLVLFVLASAMGQQFDFRADHPGIPLMIVLVVALIPLQATAEEYVFRGYLMQLIGRWLKHPAFAILLPVPLFVFGHIYDVWGMLNVGIFAVIAAWLTWRTGGLEAAIALHIVNNGLIFLLGSFSLVDANATEGTPLDLLLTTLTLVVFAVLSVRSAQRRGVARRLDPVGSIPAPLPSEPAER
jgi:membrane protease YdiL (CAAX protease family)